MPSATPAVHGIQVPLVSGNVEAELFEKWLEQFELVSSVCNWKGCVKLVNLVTHLQGQAYSFL